jgi:hypothetical protein
MKIQAAYVSSETGEAQSSERAQVANDLVENHHRALTASQTAPPKTATMIAAQRVEG